MPPSVNPSSADLPSHTDPADPVRARHARNFVGEVELTTRVHGAVSTGTRGRLTVGAPHVSQPRACIKKLGRAVYTRRWAEMVRSGPGKLLFFFFFIFLPIFFIFKPNLN